MHGTEPTTTAAQRFSARFPVRAPTLTRALADALGIGEARCSRHARRPQGEGKIARVGAIVRPNSIGASTFAAMRVRADRLEEVAEAVSRRPEVNHCYQREHEINLWFVVIAADRPRYCAFSMRSRRKRGGGARPADRRALPHRSGLRPAMRVTDTDHHILAGIEDGLPLSPRPIPGRGRAPRHLRRGVDRRLRALLEDGVIKRLG